MKSFCDRHAFRDMKKHCNQIHMMARVLPNQDLTSEQTKCENGGNCHNRVTWIIRYISDMQIKYHGKDEKVPIQRKDNEVSGHTELDSSD